MLLPSSNQADLILQARKALGLWQGVDFARFLGVSARTVQRHPRSAGVPMGMHHEKIIRALHPVNRPLAEKLAQATGTTLIHLGLEVPASPAAPKKPEKVAATRDHATLLVCTAADALNMVPKDVRPALAAVFTHAREMGVDLEGLAKLLSENTEPPKRSQTRAKAS